MSEELSTTPDQRAEPAIVVEGLRRLFWARGREPIVAIDEVSFSVGYGEVFGLLGPNGAGKTTTLHILATLTKPTSGRATVCGLDVGKRPRAVRERLGYLSATSGLPARLTGRECLLTFARLHGLGREAAEEGIARFELGEFADRFVEQLSSGMRQRLRIACAAVHRPQVLILDEPTAGLDVVATDDLLRQVEDARDQGSAVVFSTHLMHEATRVCDRVAVIFEGRIRAIGSPQELLDQNDADSLEEAFLKVIR